MPTKAVTVGTTTTKIVEADDLRTVLVIQNIDTVETVDVSDKNPDQGIRIYPKQSVDMHVLFGDKAKSRWNGIASASLTVRVFEAHEGERAPTRLERQAPRIGQHSGRASAGGDGGTPGGGGGGVRPK